MLPQLCAFALLTISSFSLLVLAGNASEQIKQKDSDGQPVLKVNARTVVVDIAVTDAYGQPVHGLSRNNFLLKEDGISQKLSSFEEHVATDPVAVKAPDLPPNVYTNIPHVEFSDALTVLLFDSLNTPLKDQLAVREEMFKYLKDPVPGRRVAIFALGSQLHYIQSFTDDPAELAAALKDLKRGAGPQASDLAQTRTEMTLESAGANPGMNSAGAGNDPEANPGVTGTAQSMAAANAVRQFFAEKSGARYDLRSSATLKAFKELAHYLAGIPGRKNVVWFSSSFPMVLYPIAGSGSGSGGLQMALADSVKETENLLTEARVAIYPIAAMGLQTNSFYDVETRMTGQDALNPMLQSLNADSISRNGNGASMDQIADMTGGKAFYNTNGLSDALAKVEQTGSSYYTLSYVPTNSESDGRYRKIRVKESKGRDHLAYRNGYFAADTKAESAAATGAKLDPLNRFMDPGLPDFAEITFAQHVQEISAAEAATSPAPDGAAAQPAPIAANISQDRARGLALHKRRRYAVDLLVAPSALQLTLTPDGVRHGVIEAALVAYDRQGHAVNWAAQTLQLTINAAQYARALKSGISCRLEIEAAQEGTRLRSGIYDMGTQKVGTIEIPLSTVTTVQTATAN